jgi:hypothetical protein
LSRIEPNLLLAVATGLPLLLLTLTAAVYGEAAPLWRWPGSTPPCSSFCIAPCQS